MYIGSPTKAPAELLTVMVELPDVVLPDEAVETPLR
jgi:hypothetical protein